MYILKQGIAQIIVSNGDNSILFVCNDLHSYWNTVALVTVSILLIVVFYC